MSAYLEQMALRERVRVLEARYAEAKSILYQSLPALGMHARGFSQEALIRACAFVGSKPEDWTQHPDVMERRREVLALPDPRQERDAGAEG